MNNRSKRFGWEYGDLVIEGDKKVLDLETLKTVWRKTQYRRLWQASARKAVDQAFKEAATVHHVTRWIPLRFSKEVLRTSGYGTPKLTALLMDDLETAFWEQDVGWEFIDEAYEKMAHMKKMEPDPSLTIDQLLADIGNWGHAWNEYQREYAMQKYGVNIHFGN